ncbi:MAG: DUF2085 domain-containing protein, partial [Chloroflexota bacterium]
MYSLNEIQKNWQYTSNPLILRQFIGNSEMGWKVAWSDRMVSMYASILIIAWIWYPLKKALGKLSILIFGFLLFPMGVDGITHLVSDFSGIGQGFRDINQWLVTLTNNRFLASFYIGDS